MTENRGPSERMNKRNRIVAAEQSKMDEQLGRVGYYRWNLKTTLIGGSAILLASSSALRLPRHFHLI